MCPARALGLSLGLALLLVAGPAQARTPPAPNSPDPAALASMPDWLSCPEPPPAAPQRLDALLRLAARVHADLAERGVKVALVSRSGLDLRAIGHEFSHSGWLRLEQGGTVRQLYLDCREGRPRVFDEGLAGFLRGVSGQGWPRLSVIEWPHPEAAALAATVADDARAQGLVSGVYRAQAPAWSQDSLNCNQWTVELLAVAFGAEPGRAGAQAWLAQAGYEPSAVRLPGPHWLLAAALSPYTSLQGHPPADIEQGIFRTSMPASIEAFIRSRWPQARRTQWCLRDTHLVVRQGWAALGPDCLEGPQDQVLDWRD